MGRMCLGWEHQGGFFFFFFFFRRTKEAPLVSGGCFSLDFCFVFFFFEQRKGG